MKLIYAELRDVDGKKIEDGVFLSYEELAQHDHDARKCGKKWTGAKHTNIALNRYRNNRCMFCGAGVGQYHRNCTYGEVNQEPYPRAAEKASLG